MADDVTSEDTSFVSKDTLTDTPNALGPLTPTVMDNNGVERLVGPALDNWEPAPVDPTPEAIAHGERINAVLAERRNARLGAGSSPALPTAEAEGDGKDKDGKAKGGK